MLSKIKKTYIAKADELEKLFKSNDRDGQGKIYDSERSNIIHA